MRICGMYYLPLYTDEPVIFLSIYISSLSNRMTAGLASQPITRIVDLHVCSPWTTIFIIWRFGDIPELRGGPIVGYQSVGNKSLLDILHDNKASSRASELNRNMFAFFFVKLVVIKLSYSLVTQYVRKLDSLEFADTFALTSIWLAISIIGITLRWPKKLISSYEREGGTTRLSGCLGQYR